MFLKIFIEDLPPKESDVLDDEAIEEVPPKDSDKDKSVVNEEHQNFEGNFFIFFFLNHIKIHSRFTDCARRMCTKSD